VDSYGGVFAMSFHEHGDLRHVVVRTSLHSVVADPALPADVFLQFKLDGVNIHGGVLRDQWLLEARLGEHLLLLGQHLLL
jgi:hypothetical protein